MTKVPKHRLHFWLAGRSLRKSLKQEVGESFGQTYWKSANAPARAIPTRAVRIKNPAHQNPCTRSSRPMWKPNASPDQPSALQPPVAANGASPAGRTFAQPQPEAFIGKSICIKGEITGSESLRIDGRVEGTVHLPDNALHIGREASVTSEITARDLVVSG